MEDKLIKAVHGFPELYNVTLISYKNNQRKETAWNKVSEQVGVPVDVCRRRWKGLRDTYIKECKKEMMANKSGSEAGLRRKWRYTGDLCFLNPFIKQRETTGLEQWNGERDHRYTEPVSPDDSHESNNVCTWQPTEIEVDTEGTDDELEKQPSVDHLMVNTLHRLSEPPVKQSSSELFCRSIVPHLERLPLEKLIKVQIQILQLVQDAMGS